MNTEKKTSFQDVKKQNEFSLTLSFGQNKVSINIMQVPLVDEVKGDAVDIWKGRYLFINQSKKGISDCSIRRPIFFYVHENKKVEPKDNNQNSFGAASVHKTNKIKLKDNNQNYVVTANNISDYLLAPNKTT